MTDGSWASPGPVVVTEPDALSTAHTHTSTSGACRTAAVELTGLSGRTIVGDVVEHGRGRPIVFLHGLVGLNEHWETVVHSLADRARCITLQLPLLDLRMTDCSLRAVVAMTMQFLNKYLEEPAVLVGNSFGGHVALRVAHERPELVGSLVLTGSSGLIERTMVKGAPVRPSREWLREKIGELFYDKSNMDPDDVERAYRLLGQRGGARAMVKLSKSARRDNMSDDLGEIEMPTLLIWGRQDIVTPPSAGQGFLELMPDAEIVWIERCGHAPMIESPGEFADAMRGFFERRGILPAPDAG